MLFRIMLAPPSYSEEGKYLVAAYESAAFGSFAYMLMRQDGEKCVATLEEARGMLPPGAERLPFEPFDQFLELWTAAENGAEEKVSGEDKVSGSDST